MTTPPTAPRTGTDDGERSVPAAAQDNDRLAREAHGSYHVATFVINKSTAQPVMLADVFGDFGSALQRLSQNASTQLSAKLGDMFRPDGVAPTAENFANWIPTSDGIELHFDDYQVGPHGLLVITVPWAVFDGIPINDVP
jgi:hypothetical protein